jgi:uncharacterized protein
MKIWIDADAAPKEAKEIVFRASTRLAIETILVANQPLQLSVRHPHVRFYLVANQPDAADRYIVEASALGDLAITADVPLAEQLVAKGVAVVDPRGVEFTIDRIGERLALRNLMDSLRQTEGINTYNPPYSNNNKQAFAATFDRVLTRCVRGRS